MLLLKINILHVKKLKLLLKSKALNILSAPKVLNKFKSNTYFKVTLKHKTANYYLEFKFFLKYMLGLPINHLQLKQGVFVLCHLRLSVGTHKVVINSGNKNYAISATSSITIEK